MKCEGARRQLSALLDRAVAPAHEQRLLAHLDGCAACRAELEALGRADRAVKEALVPAPPEGYFPALSARVAARLEARDPELADLRDLAAATVERHAVRRAADVPAELLAAAPATLGHVVLPLAAAPPRRRRALVAGLGGAVAVAASVLIIATTRRGAAPEPDRQATGTTRPQGAPPEPVPAPPAVVPRTTDPPAAVPAVASPSPAHKAPDGEEHGKAAPAQRAPAKEAPAGRAGGAPAAAAGPVDEIARKLAEPPPAPPPPPRASTGRDKLGHEDLKAGLDGVEGRVRACYQRLQVAGQVALKLRIASDGHVETAEPLPPFAGTETGSCVAAAVRAARFPPFDGAPMSINYTFTLREE